MFAKLVKTCGRLYDRVYDTRRLAFLERGVTTLACVGFVIHLAIYSLGHWGMAAVQSLFGAEYPLRDLDLIFFPQFYEVMIFTDVFLLIASFSISDRFEFVFRNAGFVISTVLLRFSLTSPKPLDLAVALTAMVFGVVVLAIFNYFAFVSSGTRAEDESLSGDRRSAA